MSKKIVVAIAFVVLAAVCVSIFIVPQREIILNNVENISIVVKNLNFDVAISDLNDIRAFKKILGKYPVGGAPSCPFGYIEIQMNQNYGNVSFFPATDGCHIIKTSDKYLYLSDNEWECVIQLLKKYGLDRSLLESGKGI